VMELQVRLLAVLNEDPQKYSNGVKMIACFLLSKCGVEEILQAQPTVQ
jgi:hypothetical protein